MISHYPNIGIVEVEIPTFLPNMVILRQIRDVIFMTVYAPLLPPLLFSLKHMTCHALTHEISDYGRICTNIFQCVK